MTRFAPIVALLVVAVIGLQMAACLASGDCLRFASGVGLAGSESPSDCDGCGCCHLHIGFEFIPPSPPGVLNELVPTAEPANFALQTFEAPYRPPRS